MSPDTNVARRELFACPEGYLIQPARPADAAPAAQIFIEAPQAARWSERAAWEIMQSPDVLAYVAQPTGGTQATPSQIVAFAAGRIVAGEAEILNLAVLQAHRRHGLAKTLVSRLLNEFAKKFVTRVFLEVRESNLAATELYRRMGFISLGRRPGYYRDPPEAALILERLQQP